MKPLSNNVFKINISNRKQQFKEINDLSDLSSSNNKCNTINNNANYSRRMNNYYINNNRLNNININNVNSNSAGKVMFENKISINKSNQTLNDDPLKNAFMIIRTELKKKDEKIRLLELQLSELEKQYNLLTNTNSNNNLNKLNKISLTNNFNKNLIFSGKNFTDLKQIKRHISPKAMIKNNRFDINLQKFSQNNSSNHYNLNYISDSEHFDIKKYNRYKNAGLSNDSRNENSILTSTSNYRIYSKGEVKLFLKEVKSRVNPVIFKEFIQNIKLLTSNKNNRGVDKNVIVENVKMLFGEEYKDLFIKFGAIIGVNN